MRYSCTAISAALLLACVSPAAAEDEPRWSLSSSVNYSVGDYGTGKDTTFIYVPFTLGVEAHRRLHPRPHHPLCLSDGSDRRDHRRRRGRTQGQAAPAWNGHAEPGDLHRTWPR